MWPFKKNSPSLLDFTGDYRRPYTYKITLADGTTTTMWAYSVNVKEGYLYLSERTNEIDGGTFTKDIAVFTSGVWRAAERLP